MHSRVAEGAGGAAPGSVPEAPRRGTTHLAAMVFPFNEREIVLRADFGRIEEGDVLSVPVRFDGGPRPPQRGEFVYLLDDGGNGCVGYVAKVRDGVARVQPVLETWRGRSAPPALRRRRDHGGVHRTLQPGAR